MNLQSKATRLPAYICNSCCLIVSDNHLHFVANKMADLYRAQFTLSSSLFLLQTIFSFFAVVSLAADRITREQSLKDGEILTSSGKSFELGFFSPSNTSLRHVGIWYSNISLHQSIVWVANRNHPLPNKNGSLTIGNDGNLLILDGNGSTIWSSQASNITENSSAILFDDGNFVLKNSDQSYSGFCWRSFDHPTNTYLPGMKLSVNAKAGVTKNFISWKNESNPSEGRYSMGVDPQAAPQIVIWNGTNRLWRTGHWNGLAFLGVPSMDVFYYYGFKLSEPDPNGTMYLTYTPYNRSSIFQFRLTWDGKEEALSWESESSEWNLLQHEPFTVCDVYNKCGNYGVCSVTNSPICDCMKGFEPNEPDQWNNGSWSGGCTRKTRLQCDGNGSLVSDDGFLKVEDLKLPDFADLVLVDEDQCDDQCLKNCSCKAYAYVSGIGCMTWIQDLLDLQQFEDGGSTLYVRLASAELGGNSKLSHPIVAAIVVGGVLLLGILLWLFWKSRAKVKVSGRKRENNEIRITNIRRSGEYSTSTSGTDDIVGGDFANAPDLPLLGYNYVAASTNYFSKENKLGQGGFGPVYKGKLPEGQEIAVKVLSRRSGQGIEEFKNEIELIAKLQHRNLVKLLGCCIQDEEKMLIYEFMPNKSLDCFIFDAEKTEQLDWRKRFIIIEGIARGLLYLHRDSRVKIVHRDLKSSNILLDKDMNPKISDFGMARIFGGNQDHANTNRVVGTYGYMSPEYAMEGLFSEKSDVFSFGVLLLEIITGRRNSRFHSADHRCLVEYAWELWTKGKAVDLIDPAIKSSCLEGQVCRCVQIALLSVQDQAVDRPTISSVVLWLESDAVVLPIPKEPTYTSSRRSGNINSHIESTDTTTGNDVTITTIVGR